MHRHGMAFSAAALILLVDPSGVGRAAGPDLEAGQALAKKHCGNCHAVGPTGESRLKAAPPFRDIAKRYSVWNLEEALAEGIVTGHAGDAAVRLQAGPDHRSARLHGDAR